MMNWLFDQKWFDWLCAALEYFGIRLVPGNDAGLLNGGVNDYRS